MRRFYYDYGGPEHEFIDEEIEVSRKKLRAKIGDLLITLLENISPVPGRSDLQRVSPDFEYKHPERYHQAIAKLHERATLVVRAYDETVRLARQKLAI
jgi:hypothetical protein